ncbi:hypothetical protein D3C72_1959620 [compost metagenome]
MWPICTVLFCTASSTCRPGTISPAAKTLMLNLPSVSSLTRADSSSEPPKMVSSDLGKLEARRHSTAGLLPTTAGAAGPLAAAGAAFSSPLPHAASAPVAATADAFNRKERRSISTSPLIDIDSDAGSRLA